MNNSLHIQSLKTCFLTLKLHFVKLILIASFYNEFDENDKGEKRMLLAYIIKYQLSDNVHMHIYIHTSFFKIADI